MDIKTPSKGMTRIQTLGLIAGIFALFLINPVSSASVQRPSYVALFPMPDASSSATNLIASYRFGGSINSIIQYQDTLYASMEWSGFACINISNPSSPTFIANVSTGGYTREIQIQNEIAFVPTAYGGVECYNLSTPGNPVLISKYGNVSVDLAVNGPYVYNVAGGLNKFECINFQNLSNPFTMGTISTVGQVLCVVQHGNYAYFGDSDGIGVVDISNPSNPVKKLTYSLQNNAIYDLAVKDNVLFVAHSSGLTALNISNGESPIILGEYRIKSGFVNNLVMNGSIAYLSCKTGGLELVNCYDPSALTFIKKIPLDGETYDVTIHGEYAFVAKFDQGIDVVNLYPMIVQLGKTTIEEGSVGNQLIWQLFDANTTTHPYIITRNETIITTGTISANNPVSIEIDNLTKGVYNYTIFITYDTNTVLQDSAIVQVIFEPFALDGMPNTALFLSSSIGIGIVSLLHLKRRKKGI